MLKSHARRIGAIVLLCAASFASANGARADEREIKAAAARDTPAAVKHGELVFHGNYCGLGNRAGADPIDALDEACMHHDACTPTGKVQSCACNARLAEEAGAVARDPAQTAELKSLAALTATAATAGMALCLPGPLIEDRAATATPAATAAAPLPATAPAPLPAAATAPSPEVVAVPQRPALAAAPVAEPAEAPATLAPPLQIVTPAAARPSAP